MYDTKEKINSGQKNSKTQALRSKKKIAKKNRLSFMLIIFALLYLPALWNWIFHDSIDTEILNTGLLELRIPIEGAFVRQETVIKAPGEGIIIPKANQRERIPNKYTIAFMVDKNSRQTLERIDKMENEIIRHAIEESPVSIDGNSEFRNKVQNEVNKLSKPAINNTMESVMEIKSALEQLLSQRNKEIFNSKEDKLYLQNEKDELNKLKNQLSNNAVEIKADFSGLVIWDDLYDEKYDPAAMELLTPEELSLENIKDSKKVIQLKETDEYFTVKENQTIARLVNNEKTWFVCAIETKKAEQIKQNDILSLKLDGIDQRFSCTVETIQPAGDKSRIIISITRMVEETIHLRNVKADLIINSVKGLKIPSRSLTNINPYDNTADIILVRLNRAIYKRVKILAQQDSIAIINALPDSKETDPVRIFDMYVVNPQNISEGQVIE